MKAIYRKLTEAEVDKKDVEILYELAREKKFSEKDLEEIAKAVNLSVDKVKRRIETLRKKKILLKDRVSILDQVKIWDGYYIVLVKAALQPPVIGMETKFPTGWAVKGYLEGLTLVEKEMNVNMIRHAYTMQGTEWDLLLIVSASSQKEYVEFMSRLAKQGWMSKAWSMTPVEYGQGWVFDPVATPDPRDVTEAKKDMLVGKDE